MAGKVTFQGSPLTLLGNELKIGDKAPDFTVLKNDLSPLSLSDVKGKVLIISAVPSLDTPVCDLETTRFNREAEKLGDKAAILTISMDLPFAQSRWCSAKGISNLLTLSDHKDASFGNAYGVLIKELRLLARAIFVVDSQGIIKYIEIVGEISNEPDYNKIIEKARELL